MAIPEREAEPFRAALTLTTHRPALPIKPIYPRHSLLTHGETTGQRIEALRKSDYNKMLKTNYFQ